MKTSIFKFGLIVIIITTGIISVSALTIHSNITGGSWDSSTTWQEGIIPGTGDTVVITSGSNVSIGHVSGYTIYHSWCTRITIESGGMLFAPEYGGGSGTFNLTVSENLINYGTLTCGEEYLDVYLSGDLFNYGYYGPHHTAFIGPADQHFTLGDGHTLGGWMTCVGGGSLVADTDFFYDGYYSVNGSGNTGDFNLNGRILNMGTHAIKAINTLIYGGTIAGDFEILGTFSLGKYLTDTVVFQGNITVTDTLQANVYGGGYGIYKLKVIGNITNNGWVKDNTDTDNDDDLNILIAGNINNNGRWTNNYINFTGTSDQYIEQSEGLFFETNFTDLNAASSIFMNSDVTITGNIDLNQATIEGQNYTLTLVNWLTDGSIHDITLCGGYLENIQSSGNLFITGKVTVDDANIFNNLVTVTDTLQSNEYGGGSTTFDLIIGGNITNNGVIQNINSGDKLKLLVQGDIVNNGEWNHSYTVLSGSGNHNLTQTQPHAFGGDFSDTDPSGMTVGMTDLTFTGNYNLGTGWLEMGGHILSMSGWLTNGTIASTILHGGYLENLISEGELTIEGLVTCSNGNHFWDNITVSDTLQSNEYGGGSTWFDLYIEGNITNNGVIRDINSSDKLRMYIAGNITNNGEWQHSATVLNGTSLQNLDQSEGVLFEGSFSDVDSWSPVVGISDLTFMGNFTLNGSSFLMNYNLLAVQGTLSNGNISNAYLSGGVISYITSLGNLTIEGTVTCDDGNSFLGITTVSGILQSNEYGGGAGTFELQVDGDLINNGIIRDINSGDRLHIYITGDLKNNGSWINNLTYLNGSEDQRIYLIGDTPIEGEVRFDAVLNTSPFQWYHEGTILNSDDFTGENNQVLIWTVPVNETWYGIFYCETGAGPSRNIIVMQDVVPPMNLQLSYDCTDVNLTWEMPAGSNPDSSNVYRDGVLIATVTQLTYTDEMVFPDQNYNYWITAVYEGIESISCPMEEIFVPVPENIQPDELGASVSNGVVTLFWAVLASCIEPDGYNVYRNGEQLNTSVIIETVYIDEPGAGTWEYYVTAVYYFGESGPSNSQIVVITGIEESLPDFNVIIYPNPASDRIMIRSDLPVTHISLVNETGTVLLNMNLFETQINLPIKQINPGNYLIVIRHGHNALTRKIIIL